MKRMPIRRPVWNVLRTADFVRQSIVGLALSVMIACLYPVTVFSAGQEEYVTVPVMCVNPVNDKDLDVMVKNKDVYVDAEMLAGWLCYKFEGDDEHIAIYDGENPENSARCTQFFYDTARVEHRLFSEMTDVYEAPFSSIRNDKGFWIPLEYSLLIFNCKNWISEKVILVDEPQKSLMDYFYEMMIHENPYHFDWYQDFSLWLRDRETDRNLSEQRVRMMNSLLGREGNLWAPSFQAYAMDFLDYNEKYAENLSLALCDRLGGGWRNSTEKIEYYAEIVEEFEKNTEEISDQEFFALSAQLDFLDTSESVCGLTDKIKQSMRGYLRILSGDVQRYSVIRDFNSALGKEETELLPVKQWKRIQGNDLLPASMKVPRYMSAPDEIEKGDRLNILYLQAFQDDVFWNFQRLYQRMSRDPEAARPADLYRLSQYCYVYLMSSFTARNAALDICGAKLDLQTKQILQDFFEEQKDKNLNILQMNTFHLEWANKTNEDGIYGFLPSDNAEYLKNYDSSKLIAYIESVK